MTFKFSPSIVALLSCVLCGCSSTISLNTNKAKLNPVEQYFISSKHINKDYDMWLNELRPDLVSPGSRYLLFYDYVIDSLNEDNLTYRQKKIAYTRFRNGLDGEWGSLRSMPNKIRLDKS